MSMNKEFFLRGYSVANSAFNVFGSAAQAAKHPYHTTKKGIKSIADAASSFCLGVVFAINQRKEMRTKLLSTQEVES